MEHGWAGVGQEWADTRPGSLTWDRCGLTWDRGQLTWVRGGLTWVKDRLTWNRSRLIWDRGGLTRLRKFESSIIKNFLAMSQTSKN